MKTGVTQAHIRGQTLTEVCKILSIQSTWNNRTNGTAVISSGGWREGEEGGVELSRRLIESSSDSTFHQQSSLPQT